MSVAWQFALGGVVAFVVCMGGVWIIQYFSGKGVSK